MKKIIIICLFACSYVVDARSIGQQQSLVKTMPSSGNVVELVTSDANSFNSWGGHQTRIVRNNNGIYASYIVNGTGTYPHTSSVDREWCLVKRRCSNEWNVIAKGPSGRDPVNIVTSPDGNIYVFATPDKSPAYWEIDPNGAILKDRVSIPGNWENHDVAYTSAGISLNGNMTVLQSENHKFHWSYYNIGKQRWTCFTRDISSEKRHCYTYVFPTTSAGLYLISTRDVLWSEVGLCQPAGAFNYVFNAIGYFNSPNVFNQPNLSYLKVKEAVQINCEKVRCNAQMDNYIDTLGRIHVLYAYQDGVTATQTRHAVIQNGTVVADVALPSGVGDFKAAMIEDDRGTLYLITDIGVYRSLNSYGTVLDTPVPINLGGYPVEYSGICLAAPRSGTPLAPYVDGGFPSRGGKQWVYFRHYLRDMSYEETTKTKSLRVVIVGDSTVADFPESDKMCGWGQVISEYFNDEIEFINMAMCGRSSKSFINEGSWNKCLEIKPDYFLIQFGHNDDTGHGSSRCTDPELDYQDYLRKYINDAKTLGAVPILVTPVARRTFDENGRIKSTLLPYAEAMRKVGRQTNTAVIDLHKASMELFNSLGDADTHYMGVKFGDRTHFSKEGARVIARLVVNLMKKLDKTNITNINKDLITSYILQDISP